MAQDTWLIIGLGNPGDQYAATRHNIGHMVVDELLTRTGGKLGKSKARALVSEGRLGMVRGVPGPRAVLAKSLTYMNESGGPVSALTKFYSIEPDHVVAIHDDVDIPFDTIKLKLGGGEGGHNGLRSMTKSLGTKDYLRVRAGVGRPPVRMETADYVLKPFSKDERASLPIFVSDVADAVEMLLTEGLEKTQLKYHSR
ncbi:aminoacyl-tRNA hydrolase [Brevibacterium samyangense]|uniref:Peptidyl-tRNA hydrolase n=1 Tax=Brevibacterium samyangense TaxID=366888 RepID=A0ABN2TQ51_9MICO